MIGVKPLRIRVNKIDGFIRVYNGTGYLALFGAVKNDFIYNRIRCLTGVKSSLCISFLKTVQKSKLIYIIFCLFFEKTLTFYNAIIHIKSDQHHYYYNALLV